MKRIIFSLALALVALTARAQNIQLHYDLGSTLDKDLADRPALTTTVELFKPDSWGNTFFFVDMNYQASGIQSAYWEIARELRLWRAPLSLHLEYNGGLSNTFSYDDAYLLGGTYAYNAKDYRYGFTITPMYKYLARKQNPHSWQLTSVWYWHACGRLVTFNGFVDLWGDRDMRGDAMLTIISEPQIWLNLQSLWGEQNPPLSLGGELEISYNFPVRTGRWQVIPTLAAKWTF